MPQRVVRVLEHRVRQRGRLAPPEGVVEQGQLAGEDADRPAVGHDVVNGHEQFVLIGTEPQQGRPEEGPPGQVERALGLLTARLLDTPGEVGARDVCQIHDVEPRRLRRGDSLHGFAIDALEGGAEGFMAAQKLRASLPQCRDVEWRGQLLAKGDRVSGAVGFQLIEKPQSPLGERQRQELLRCEAGRALLGLLSGPCAETSGETLRLSDPLGVLVAGHVGTPLP